MQKNHIELAGYLANKPEARYLPSGTKVANARLKESYRFTGSDGQQQTHANCNGENDSNQNTPVVLIFQC